MPDKQNENKFLAMLERKGIVSRADSADKPTNASSEKSDGRAQDDLSSMFGHPDAKKQDTQFAPRQPVPGMINPTRTPENQPQSNRTESQPRQAEQVVPIRASSDATAPEVVARPEEKEPAPVQTGQVNFDRSGSVRVSGDISKEVTPEEKPQAASAGYIKPEEKPQVANAGYIRPEERPQAASAGYIRPEERQQTASAGYVKPEERSQVINNTGYARPEERSQSMSAGYTQLEPQRQPLDTMQGIAFESQQAQTPPPPQRTTDRYLDIEEIYTTLSINSKPTDTVYLIEEYLKTLPDSLPEVSKREIVGKIVAASGFDYDMLMGDGVLRVKMIKDYAEKFARYTDEYVSIQNAELAELERQMKLVKTLIDNRRELHRRQFLTIEAEAQRLKEILLFISG